LSHDQLPPQNSNDHEASSATPPSTSLEEVRKRLQSFGYLNSKIERFYLLSLSRTASQFLNRLVLSFRVGILAGTVGAILMTAGTLVFNIEILKRPFDIALLLFYFEVFFVLAFTLLEFVLIILVAGLVRITERSKLFFAGQAISFLIGILFFGYFFYWGRTQIDYLRLFSNVSIVAMFLVVTLSCILVAKFSWLGFLVAFRESETGRLLPNWKKLNAEFLLALTAILVLLPFVLTRGESSAKSNPPMAVFSTPDRWILVAIDGISLELLQRFSNSGALPHLHQMMLESEPLPLQMKEPPVPPVVWTSVATGVPSSQHGIRTPEVRRWRGQSSWIQETPLELAVHSIMVHAGFGQRQPVSGYLRKVKTFWEILSDSGMRVGIINWWGSWPARWLRGWNISERYYYKLASHGSSQEETYPRELFQQYAPLYKGKGEKISGPELDQFYFRVFQEQLKNDPVRVAAIYLPGLDILNYEHFEAKRIDPFTYTETYSNELKWLDGQLNDLKVSHPEYRFLLIFYQGRSLMNHHSCILFDRPVQRRITPSEYDVAPLLLYRCGLPVARSMNLNLIRAVTNSDLLVKMPVRFVASYDAPKDRIEFSHADQFNDLLVEQMKSLGYLQ
jgi:Type I phosphodiesterase / nucleotide pyrophosphatase